MSINERETVAVITVAYEDWELEMYDRIDEHMGLPVVNMPLTNPSHPSGMHMEVYTFAAP